EGTDIDRPLVRVRATACLLAMTAAALSTMLRAEPAAGGSVPNIRPAISKHERLDALRAARQHGLDPQDYGLAQLEALADDDSGEAQTRFDTRLDESLRAYALDLAYGRLIPAAADPDWHIPAPVRGAVAGESAVAGGAEAAGSGPPHEGYRRLREAMIRYLAIRDRGGWGIVPAGPELSVGMRHEQVEIARNRLRRTGDFNGDTQADAWMFGAALDAAVRNFQVRHGLRADGVIDETTRETMNVPVGARIRQLSVAMERWRWLPRDLGHEYVWVDLARLKLDVMRDGGSVFSSRTIVGHATRPTPSLRGEIRQLVFNPSWSVPMSIATQDLLPKVQSDAGFLERHGFRVFTGRGDAFREVDPAGIDWASLGDARLPYRFVQRPGPLNSLGRVKFVFDNPFDIYLHDTPTKGLFMLRTRTFSSGCVRVERAGEFADFLLADDRGSGDTGVTRWRQDPETRAIDLGRPMPIYLVYITSWVGETGRVNFRRDLYRRDAGVAGALSEKTDVRHRFSSYRSD
ncbi:MAG: murein L,D-transpeptidase, partial [Gammaproteobacteria bacterium]